jgi:hypothetical protein
MTAFTSNGCIDKISTLCNKHRNGLTDDRGHIAVVPFNFTSELSTSDEGELKENKEIWWARDV